MAFKLPFREDFESWTTSQVADLFKQCGIQECIGVLEKLGLNGYSFLNMTTDELNKFNILYQPQLQRIVSDIKKNESGLFKKIKKFQNDQVALICKTGKDTWDRMKSKPTPPTVPRRDYQTGPPNGDDDEWGDDFGSDYDSPDEHSDTDQYAVPTDEADDSSYEPPPNDKHVTPSFKVMMANNGYADKQKTEPMNMHMRPPPKPHEPFSRHQQPPPPVTNRLPTANKPLPKPRHHPTSMPPPVLRKPASIPPQPDCDDEENYIVPESESYIEPTKEPVKKPPAVNRQNKPMPPTPMRSPTMQPPEAEDELYVVPENETTPSPPKRGLLPKVTPPSYLDQDEYEVCEDLPEIPFKPKPSPSPRNVRPKPPTNFLQKPNMVPVLPQREINSNIDKPQVMQRQRIHSSGNEPPPVPPMPHKLPLPLHKPNVITIQKPPEVATRYIPGPSRHGSTVEQDADVLNKEWYVSSCDRRKAEDALTATSKDGSFLVRKSSGQDSQQPFTLVVFYNRRVYNIPVRYIEATRQYALGREKSGEEKFHSVAEIIENHRQTPLVLIDSHNNTKDSTRLKQGVRIS